MKPKLPVYLFGGLAVLLLCIGLYQYVVAPDDPSGKTTQIAPESPERLARIKAMAEKWQKQPSFEDRFNPLNPSAEIDGESNTVSANLASVTLPVSPDGAHDLVAGYCSGCHSLDIVTQQHASPERWKQLLVWMEEKQGMPPLPDNDEAIILGYLAQNF